ncbi:uncharacterized protein [Argopecten irradians]|uniref:uncharacterized protein n=1 Tax=Argopecten irradians TaxID=31199 RepID=UPI00371505DF
MDVGEYVGRQKDVEEYDGRLKDVGEYNERLDKLILDGKSINDSIMNSASINTEETDLLIIPEDHIPIGNESDVSVKDDRLDECGAERSTVTDDRKINDIFDEIGYFQSENTNHIESDKLYLLRDEDIELAARVGLIRRSQIDRRAVVPDRKAMRVLLRHIYDVTGEVYDDIPAKYRTSHVSLAFYLKLCIRAPERQVDSSMYTYGQTWD